MILGIQVHFTWHAPLLALCSRLIPSFYAVHDVHLLLVHHNLEERRARMASRKEEDFLWQRALVRRYETKCNFFYFTKAGKHRFSESLIVTRAPIGLLEIFMDCVLLHIVTRNFNSYFDCPTRIYKFPTDDTSTIVDDSYEIVCTVFKMRSNIPST